MFARLVKYVVNFCEAQRASLNIYIDTFFSRKFKLKLPPRRYIYLKRIWEN